MATTTPRIGLTKPDGTDLVDIAVLNTNFDKIDSNIASTKIQSTKPTTANAGDLWWDSDTGTLYLYYVDANSSQWVAATSDPINIGVVASQAERDAQYPSPQQGMRVYRTDLGAEETYYGLYNVSSNPGGRATAGWYLAPVGRVIQVVSGAYTNTTSNSTTTFENTGLAATITPTSINSKILVLVTQNGLHKTSGSSSNGVHLKIVRGTTDIQNFAVAYGFDGVAIARYIGSASGMVLDSPATISPVTYKTQFRNDTNAANVSVQISNATSTITLVEVSA